MDFKVTFSKRALGELAAITTFVAQDNPEAARELSEKLHLLFGQREDAHGNNPPFLTQRAPESHALTASVGTRYAEYPIPSLHTRIPKLTSHPVADS